MLALLGAPLLLLASHLSYIKAAANNLEAATLGSISMLLSPDECHELYIRIAIPQKESEMDGLDPPSQWQDIVTTDQCKESLGHWLEMQGRAIDWDRLARALRQIGRPDISRELKKSLNKNRSLEPKWNLDDNQTMGGTPKSALLVEDEVPSQRSRYGPLQRHRKAPLKESNLDLRSFFLQLLPSPLHNFSLQQHLVPVIQLLIASFLSGLVLWLASLCYIICWSLWQCLFANGIRYSATPGNQNMNLTLIWNHTPGEGSLDYREDWGTSEDENSTEEER
ncbi:hypothetical protein EYD10_07157 [Varanus komodoensis]|nr:hypothetical protein EYD10_07157 [Varanus komodoensis]